MSYKQHTFFYKDTRDYIRQLDMELQRVTSYRMEAYEVVRARYNSKPAAFCMRLRRFIKAGGTFPHALGSKGRRIIELGVTPALDAWLSK